MGSGLMGFGAGAVAGAAVGEPGSLQQLPACWENFHIDSAYLTCYEQKWFMY